MLSRRAFVKYIYIYTYIYLIGLVALSYIYTYIDIVDRFSCGSGCLYPRHRFVLSLGDSVCTPTPKRNHNTYHMLRAVTTPNRSDSMADPKIGLKSLCIMKNLTQFQVYPLRYVPEFKSRALCFVDRFSRLVQASAQPTKGQKSLKPLNPNP